MHLAGFLHLGVADRWRQLLSELVKTLSRDTRINMRLIKNHFFQISDYFVDMYTAPATPEQCLHNTLILVQAMRSVGIDYDIQATDITDPNPITLLMVSWKNNQNAIMTSGFYIKTFKSPYFRLFYLIKLGLQFRSVSS